MKIFNIKNCAEICTFLRQNCFGLLLTFELNFNIRNDGGKSTTSYNKLLLRKNMIIVNRPCLLRTRFTVKHLRKAKILRKTIRSSLEMNDQYSTCQYAQKREMRMFSCLPLLLRIRVGGKGFENLFHYKNFIFSLLNISLTTALTPQRTFLCATKGLKEV